MTGAHDAKAEIQLRLHAGEALLDGTHRVKTKYAQRNGASPAAVRANQCRKGGNRADARLRRFSWEEGQ